MWDGVRRRLKGIPVLTPALPGRRGAGEPVADVAGHAAAVLSAMDAAGVTRATIAGHSLGGGVALWLALNDPARVAAVGLVSTGARLRVRPEALAALPDGLEEASGLMAAANFSPGAPEELIEARRREYLAVGGATVLADLTACDRFDVLDRLWEIRCRAQVLVGGADVLTPPKYAHAMAERISAARLIEYPGAGHMLPVERPAEVAGELAVLWAAALDGPGGIASGAGWSAAAQGRGPGSRRRTG
jgi:3-oxoadipate enol-lactonase/4-carboxymuconolactone decarboxylase